MLNMKKKLEKEEQELRERKSALELARKLATEKQQKVLDQATVVSDLKLQLVGLRQDIANNPTPQVSEDEGVTQLLQFCSSRFFLWTEFNSDAVLQETLF